MKKIIFSVTEIMALIAFSNTDRDFLDMEKRMHKEGLDLLKQYIQSL